MLPQLALPFVGLTTGHEEEETLSLYLREVRQIPLLTAQEEQGLIERMRTGDGAARDRLVRANLRLVVRIARG